jgi:hypothetical protein
MLANGAKLFVTHRRLFDKEESRYFACEVDAYDVGIVKATGYSFVRDMASGRVLRKDDRRTKLFSITSGAFLVYQLPDEIDLDAVQFVSRDDELSLTDGKHFKMNMAELPHQGQI